MIPEAKLQNSEESPATNGTIRQLPKPQNSFIPGGYVMISRQTPQSSFFRSSPCVRELWTWLIMRVNHTFNERLKIERGECVCTMTEMIEDLRWYVGASPRKYSKTQCATALNILRKHEMITTRKTTRGLRITVCNYDRYQTAGNYVDYTEDNSDTTRRLPQPSTINKNVKNDKNKEINIYRDLSNLNIPFEHFWEAYDKKEGNVEEMKSLWNDLSNEDRDKAFNYLAKYKQAKPDPKFRYNPLRYIREKKWKEILSIKPEPPRRHVYE